MDLTPYVPRLVLGREAELDEGPSVLELEGAMVAIDLSGFTAMSERLAALGREGAEEVTAVVSATFTGLLAVAYGLGGSLLKFGGDALLLWFDGEAAAHRATLAGHGMRARLRALNPVQTSRGAIRLRMTVGVHAGAFHFFMVGASHRELIVAGPSASATVRAESSADKNQILVTESVADLLPRSCTGELARGLTALRRRPPDVPAGAPNPVEPSTRAATFVPTALRDHLTAGGGAPEHRQAAVAFVHFGGVDEVVRADARDAAGRLDRLVRAAQQAAERHEVTFLATDVDVDGGKVILVAGAPVGHDDDAGRLLTAAHEIVASDHGLHVTAGVHAGALFAGEVGPPYRRVYTVMGDTVNTSARIMARAADGEVLASPDVLARSEILFELGDVVEFAAKGKAELLRAHAVGAPLGPRTAADSVELVGRAAELEALAAVSPGELLVMTGPAGSGKSRLLDEARRRADESGRRTSVVVADRLDSPWSAIRRLTTSSLDIADHQLTARLGVDDVGLGHAPPGFDAAACAAVRSALSDEALEATLVVDDTAVAALVARAVVAAIGDVATWIVDRAEELDHGSLLALTAMTELARAPALVVGAREAPSALLDRATRHLDLEPLSDDDAAQLIDRTSLRDLLPHERAELVRRAGGLPASILALMAAFDEAGELNDLPESLEAAATARIDRMSPPDRRAIRELATLGFRWPASLAEAIAVEIGPTLSAHLRNVDGTIEFVDPLLWEAARSGLPFRARRRLHSLVVGHLRQTDRPDLELLSYHAHEAGLAEDCWDAATAAAAEAIASFATAQAAVHLDRALGAAERMDVAPSPGELAEARLQLAVALDRLGHQDSAAETLRRARRLDAPLVVRLEIHFRTGELWEQRGHLVAAVRWYLRGVRLGAEAEPTSARSRAELARLRAAIATIRLRQQRLDEGEGLIEEAIDDARAAGDHDRLAGCLHVAAMIAEARGDVTVATELELEALELARDGSRPGLLAVIRNGLGWHAFQAGRWSEAAEHYAEAAEVLERWGSAMASAIVRGNAAQLLADQGHHEDALRLFEGAASTLRAIDVPFYEAAVAKYHGTCLAQAGRMREAEELLDRSLATFTDNGALAEAAETLVRRAEVRLLAGQPDAALRDLGEAADHLAPDLAPLAALLAAKARWASEGDEVARPLLERALAEAEHADAPFHVARARQALARLAIRTGGHTDDHLDTAQAIQQRLGIVASTVHPLPARGVTVRS